MVDRHLIGDIGLAVLLAVPTLALARPQAEIPHERASAQPLIEMAAGAEGSSADRRFSLPG